jgi:hypothetical protein
MPALDALASPTTRSDWITGIEVFEIQPGGVDGMVSVSDLTA